MKTQIQVGENILSLKDVEDVAFRRVSVDLSDGCASNLVDRRKDVEAFLLPDAPPAYGINTGFGALAETQVKVEEVEELQANLIRSHCTGIGEPFSEPITRAIMLLRAHVLAKRTSGVRPELPRMLCKLLNEGIYPLIPEKGSVGASGDLAPLAHLARSMMGEGSLTTSEGTKDSQEVLIGIGLQPLNFSAKEGLALINGTQAMTADLALTLSRAQRLLDAADGIAAFSAQVLLGSATPYDRRIHEARPQNGQLISASNISTLMAGSPLVDSHAECEKVQDPYCLRCAPQVHGASRTAIMHASEVVSIELNAATDNPLLFDADSADGRLDILSGGNFHGQPIALVADYTGLALAELANISERRIEQLVNPALSSGLPPFLSAKSGLNSGFMIAQVTAAALVSENKVLVHPASADSIPSSANREDHVSMGTIAARQARQILEHAEWVLSIELMCAAQALDLRRPLRGSAAIESMHVEVRNVIPMLNEDRFLQTDIEAMRQLIISGKISQICRDVWSGQQS